MVVWETSSHPTAGQSCSNREREQAEGPREDQEQQPQSHSEAEEEPFTYVDCHWFNGL